MGRDVKESEGKEQGRREGGRRRRSHPTLRRGQGHPGGNAMASRVRRRWRFMAGVLVVLAGCLLVCWHFGIWSRQDYRDYHTLGDYALGPDLWHGRIVQGQDVEGVT